MRTLPLAEAKAKLSEIVDTVARRDERVTITKHGHPAAVLMSHDEAASMEATFEIMSDPEFYAEILRSRAALDRGEGTTIDLDDLLGEEVRSHRARTSRRASAGAGRGRPTPPARSEAKGARRAGRARARSRSR